MFSGPSNISDIVNHTFIFILAVCVALLAVVTFFMVYFIIKYSRKRHPVAEEVKGNALIEVLWTVIPTALVLVMFYYGWTGFRIMRDAPRDAMVVKVNAQMWAWSFEYENGKPSRELNVPLNKPVKLALSSRDVIHSFFIPAFRVKEDAVPGLNNYLWFKPTELGSFDVECTQYCGLGHSQMMTKVNVMPEDKFNEWYASKESEAPTGQQGNKGSKPVVESKGLLLIKGKGTCITCHSLDRSKLIGPTFKGLFGKKETVVTAGKERTITVDEAYIRKSILEPNADIVKGYPPLMPSQKGLLTDAEINDIIQYFKQQK